MCLLCLLCLRLCALMSTRCTVGLEKSGRLASFLAALALAAALCNRWLVVGVVARWLRRAPKETLAALATLAALHPGFRYAASQNTYSLNQLQDPIDGLWKTAAAMLLPLPRRERRCLCLPSRNRAGMSTVALRKLHLTTRSP